MIKTVKINEFPDNKELTAYQKSKKFLTPEYIYIPLFDNNIEYQCLVEINEKVKVGQVVAKSKKYDIPYHSSVSGEVESIECKMWTTHNKMVNCIKIKNDYLDNSIINYSNHTLDRESLIKIIKECGIVGMGGAGFPTYIKYNNDNIKTLIINACECEPFITCDYRLLLEQTIKFINGIHYALLATNAEQAVIAIKYNKREVIEILNEYIDDKIKIYKVKDMYPVGWEKYLVNKIIKKNYNKLPIEVNCIVSNVATIISVDEAIKYNKPLIEKMITVSGYSLNKPINVYCKIGTSFSEIISNIGGLKDINEKSSLIVGGAMTGRSAINNNIVITKSLNSIIITPVIEKNNMISCIGCGKCSLYCPSKLTPTQIIKQYTLKNNDELEKLKTLNCVSCGVCSYVCPSHIELTFLMNKSKEYLVRGKYGK